MFLREFLYDFIRLFAPHLSRDIIDQAMHIREKKDWEDLFKNVALPLH
jgi:LysR family cys regulon transcriptional activator